MRVFCQSWLEPVQMEVVMYRRWMLFVLCLSLFGVTGCRSVPTGRKQHVSYAASIQQKEEETVTESYSAFIGSTRIDVAYGESVKDVKIPSKFGYFFCGYFFKDKSGEEVQLYDSCGKCVREWEWDYNVILYAKWFKRNISMNYDGTIAVGKSITFKLDAEITGYSVEGKNAVYSCSGDTVKIKGKSPGLTRCCISIGTRTVMVSVNVKKKPVKVSVGFKKLKLKRYDFYTLHPKVGKEYFCGSYSFSSSNRKVASVSSDGAITARRKGRAVITVSTDNRKTCKIHVKVV